MDTQYILVLCDIDRKNPSPYVAAMGNRDDILSYLYRYTKRNLDIRNKETKKEVKKFYEDRFFPLSRNKSEATPHWHASIVGKWYSRDDVPFGYPCYTCDTGYLIFPVDSIRLH